MKACRRSEPRRGTRGRAYKTGPCHTEGGIDKDREKTKNGDGNESHSRNDFSVTLDCVPSRARKRRVIGFALGSHSV